MQGADLSSSILTGANLSDAVLTYANLSDANLSSANLSGALLLSANLRKTNLTNADLSKAKFLGAYLIATTLDSANLSDADLSGASFNAATLTGAQFSGALLTRTSFSAVDLSEVKGLDKCIFEGQFSVGIDTIYKSHAKIPDAFLHAAGASEQLINYVRSLGDEAIQFCSCFISYSSRDEMFADQLYADLRRRNLRVWYAQEDVRIGDRFQERIEESILQYDKVMIILSEASVQSGWVEREVSAAREREYREKQTVLFPIRIDDAVMDTPQPWVVDICRTRHIGNFCHWKDHDSYQKAFDRLLKDLKTAA